MHYVTPLVVALAAVSAAGASPKKPPDLKQLSDRQLAARFGAELPNARLAAAKELASRGERVLPAVAKALASDDWRVRRAATDVAMGMGKAAAGAAPALARLLTQDKNAWVRDGAAEALGRTGVSTKPVVAALVKGCVDPDEWVRYMAAQSLTRGTKDPDILVPAAIEMLRQPGRFPRGRGVPVGILRKHGKGREGVIPVLLDVIDHPSEGMFSPTGGAVDALLACGAEPKGIREALERLARSTWWAHRTTAVRLLGKLGQDAKPSIPLLKQMAQKDPHRKVRAAAQSALNRLEEAKAKK